MRGPTRMSALAACPARGPAMDSVLVGLFPMTKQTDDPSAVLLSVGGLVGQDQRHHVLGHDAECGHGGDVGAGRDRRGVGDLLRGHVERRADAAGGARALLVVARSSSLVRAQVTQSQSAPGARRHSTRDATGSPRWARAGATRSATWPTALRPASSPNVRLAARVRQGAPSSERGGYRESSCAKLSRSA